MSIHPRAPVVPDWSTVWVAMIASAVVAALYATGLAIHLVAGPGSEVILDISDLHRSRGSLPAVWCGMIVAFALGLAYVCGIVSHRWRKAYRAAMTSDNAHG